MGAGMPSIGLWRFWLYVAGGVFVEWVLVNVKNKNNAPYKVVPQDEALVIAITLITVLVLLPSLIAWLIGKSKRDKTS